MKSKMIIRMLSGIALCLIGVGLVWHETRFDLQGADLDFIRLISHVEMLTSTFGVVIALIGAVVLTTVDFSKR